MDSRIRAVIQSLESRVLLSNVVVNSVSDTATGSGVVTLTDAIADANTATSATTITFDPTVFSTDQTIKLDGTKLELTNTNAATTITAPAAGLTISGNDKSSVLYVAAGVTATLNGLTITAGDDRGVQNAGTLDINGGAISGNSAPTVGGGGIQNNANLTMNGVTISNNVADGHGGGLENIGADAIATLTDVTVSDNSVTAAGGGGIASEENGGSGTTTLILNNVMVTGNSASGNGGGILLDSSNVGSTFTDVTIEDNTAGADGGGIANLGGSAVVTGSTVSGNKATKSDSSRGGGIYDSGTLTVSDSVINGNTTPFYGGGIDDEGGVATMVNDTIAGNTAGGNGGINAGANSSMTITNLTVSGNSALGGGGTGPGAGGVATDPAYDGTVTLANTIIAGNTAAAGSGESQDVANAMDSLGHNLIGDTNGSSGWLSTDLTGTSASPLSAGLGALANNGGPTETMLPETGSEAISHGSVALIPAGVTTDQRGDPRTIDGAVDIGAVEVGGTPVVSSSPTEVNSTSDTATGTGIVTLRDAIATANASTTPTTITFDPTVFATAQTIVLDGTQLTLSNTADATTIIGPSSGVTISGNGVSRIFDIDSGVTATMYNLTLTDGAATATSTTGDRGGAIENHGNLTVSDSLFSDNTAKSFGGAINEDYPGAITLINDTLTGNKVTGPAPSGAGAGGAISVAGTVTLEDDTLSGNTAPGGGGMNENNATGDPFTLSNTIVAGNVETSAGTGDAYGTYVSDGHNLIGNTQGSSGWISSDLTGTAAAPLNPQLGSLTENGGPTETILPLTGSPAIGAGSVALIPSGVTTDQRGDARTLDGTVDIGAVEVGGTSQSSIATTTVLTASSSNVSQGTSITLTATVTPANSSGGTIGGTVNFYQNGGLLGSAVLQSNGSAVFGTSSLAVGTDSLTVIFVPSGSVYAGSSSTPISVIITPGAVTLTGTTITLVTSQSQALVGEQITLTATVVAVAGGAIPTGTVQFFDGTILLGTGIIGSTGIAVLVLLPTSPVTSAAGSYVLTAVYVPTGSFSGSTSPGQTQVVTAPTSSVTVTVTGGTIVIGETVTYTATIIVVAGGPVPTGTVTFSSGGTVLGIETVQSNGTAVLTIESLPVGSDPLTVVYSGDANYTPSLPVVQPVVVYEPGVLPVVSTGTVPGTFISGYISRGKLRITIDNPTASLLKGVTIVKLFGSLSGMMDENTILIETFKVRIRIAAGASEVILLNFTLPLTLAAGSYTLLFGVETLQDPGVLNYSPTGPTLIVVQPVTELNGPANPLNLGSTVIAGQPSRARVRLVITNSGNVASIGPALFLITLSPTAGVVGVEVLELKVNVNIKAGKSRTLVLPIAAFPALPAGAYYLVVQVTDPRDNVTLLSSGSTIEVVAPVVTLSAAFAPDSSKVNSTGAWVTITNSGNVQDSSAFTAVAGFALDAAGTQPVPNLSGTQVTPIVRIRAGKSVRLHLDAWKSLVFALAADTDYYATLAMTDATGNVATAVNPEPLAG